MTRIDGTVYKGFMMVSSPTILSVRAEAENQGMRLDRFLSEAFETLSRSRAKTLIKEVGCLAGQARTNDPKQKVRSGVTYRLELPAPVAAEPEPENIPLDICFEDDHLLLVNKPARMAVHPAPGSWTGTLVNALLHHCQGKLPGIGGVERPGIVHRIDKNTTGVMVVAKSEAAHRGLSDLFAKHDINRTYLALTRSAPRPLSGTIDAPLGRSLTDRKKIAVIAEDEARDGRRAITHYQALATYGRVSKVEIRPSAALVECRLETGRTHQIRVHMAHIGTPLIGDPVYGRHRGIKSTGSGADYDAAMQTTRAIDRQALHAASLGFVHPVTGDNVFVEVPLPDDMAAIVRTLERL